MTKVQGFCPMGCGSTLFLGSGGYITCSLDRCPNPTGLSDLLLDPETEHIVELDGNDFNVQHPLRERLDGALFNCSLHGYLAALGGPPRQEGTYRVWWSEKTATSRWELIVRD